MYLSKIKNAPFFENSVQINHFFNQNALFWSKKAPENAKMHCFLKIQCIF